MQTPKIVIAGGTGFIGEYFQKRFLALGYKVYIISRNKTDINWNDEEEIINVMNGAVMLVNLAGKSVNCRYNEQNKNEILNSRLDTTIKLGNAILKCNNPPLVWINSSTATIYRYAEDRPMTESNGEIGTGFSVSVATKWEEAFFNFKLKQTRQIALRIAIVLGKNGGALKPMINLVRFGLGGKQGNGKQMFSWIHIEDLFQILLFLKANKDLHGVINCSSANPISNKNLMLSLRKAIKTYVAIPTPSFLLHFGARLINTEVELILKSRWVIPEKLINEGFKFQYSTIEKALENILSKNQEV